MRIALSDKEKRTRALLSKKKERIILEPLLYDMIICKKTNYLRYINVKKR